METWKNGGGSEVCTGDAPCWRVCGWRGGEGSTPFALVPGASRGEGRHGSRKWVAGWLPRLGRHERNTREHEYARREISAVP